LIWFFVDIKSHRFGGNKNQCLVYEDFWGLEEKKRRNFVFELRMNQT